MRVQVGDWSEYASGSEPTKVWRQVFQELHDIEGGLVALSLASRIDSGKDAAVELFQWSLTGYTGLAEAPQLVW